MTLSIAQQNYNREQLQLIKALILSLQPYHDKGEQLQHIEELILRALDHHEILLGLAEGDQRLQNLLQDALRDSQNLEQKLERWALHYKKLEKKASKELRRLSNKQAHGIARSLMTTGVASYVWGNDYDLRILFKDIMTDSHDITESGTYILPPISLVAAAHASQAEQSPFLKESIEPALKASKNKNITLLIPVNCRQSHWCLAEIKMNDGSLQSATLWDSVANPNLKETQAFQNMQKMVSQINPKAHCDAKTTGKQTDGFSCMDCTAQKALVLFSETKYLDQGSIAVRDAADSKTRREAVITKIIENHPQLKAKQECARRDETNEVFKNPKLTPEVEEELLTTLENKANAVDTEKFAKIRKLQIEFDAILAETLSALYQSKPNEDEEVLLKIARKEAFHSIKNNFGFFAGKADQPVNTDESISSRAVSRKTSS